MLFLLTAINAKYIHSNPAIYSLQKYADRYREHIALAEYTINQSVQDILADIYEKEPDAVGFSCYIWNWEPVQEIAAQLHQLRPELPIWLGGPEVSYDADRILRKMPFLAGIMLGEGEETFAELMAYYVDKKGSLREIKGLELPEGNTGQRAPLDLSGIPFLYDFSEDCLAGFAHKIIYYESQRGCPFRCSYCLSSVDKTLRIRDIDVVKRELRFFLDSRIKQVKFVDRTFNCHAEHAMSIWQYLYENDNGVTNFHFEIAGDLLTDEQISLLQKMRPGLVQLEIGVQSVNAKTLQEIRRSMDMEKLRRAVAALREGHNIHIHLDLIVGLPFEDEQSFARSFEEVYSMQPEQLQVGFLKVLKGSYMQEAADSYGLVYTQKPPYEVLCTKWLSYTQVRRLKRIEEMVEIYYNSNQFCATLRYLRRQFSTAFEMFDTLACYYKSQGLYTETPSRAYRYEALFDFAVQISKKHVAEKQNAEEFVCEERERYRELLTFDLYRRENIKSRPDFAPDLKKFRESINEIYRKEALERKLLPAYSNYDGKQLARMTHIEMFQYCVWEEQVTKMPEKIPVLFDYGARNALTHDARVMILAGNMV